MKRTYSSGNQVNFSSYLKLLRPAQWLKNLMIFFPPFLGGSILQAGIPIKGVLPFTCFCFASSSTYIFNDVIDRQYDLNHPRKKNRPVCSGRVSVPAAAVISVLLAATALGIGYHFSTVFFVMLTAYLTINVAYSLKLKHVPLVDIFCISAGFIIRLQAGGEVYGITISEWLFLSVFLLSLFLSTGKRLSELLQMGENAGNHRKCLSLYHTGFLEGTMYMTGGTVLVTYAMFVISRHYLIYSIPLCCFGLLRYIFRVKAGLGGDPTESLIKDLPLFLVGNLWAAMVCWSIYFKE